jgi:hypothetical protein
MLRPLPGKLTSPTLAYRIDPHMPLEWWLPIVLLTAASVAVALFVWLRPRRISVTLARALFERQRAALEAEFFQAAAGSGKPRGLRWTRCEWGDAVEYARDERTGQLLAFVAVTIAFEAIEGGDMEGLPAVSNLRNASAMLFFDGSGWRTHGRTVFNLNPDEAIRHFGKQLERVVDLSPKR